MREIKEIFYSLQGEGAHAGTPAVFVRFSGCNLRCPFCDTDHLGGIMMNDEEIFREVSRYPARWVILTGGEPALHIDRKFVERLKAASGKKIAVETNGTIPLPDGIDWVTVSPKFGICGSSGGGEVRVTHADEIKVVDIGQNLEPYFHLPCNGPRVGMYLQPCYIDDKKEREAGLKRTVARVMSDPRWSLSLQLHRILGIQ